MSRRTVFTTITPLPPGVTRDVVLDFLSNHLEMIDLNPLVKERHPIKPPPHASPEEFHCIWYSLTDKISYLPGNLATGDVNYTCAFHDLPNGLQTHCYAPMGLDIRDKWTLGGSLPGEQVQPVELGIGAPITGLYIREDIDMKCNILMTGFVKKNLKKSHAVLVDRMKVKAQIASAANLNHTMSIRNSVNSATSQNGQAQGGSPEPNQYPVRPASTATTATTATTASGNSVHPAPVSPDPTRTDFPAGSGAPHRPFSPPAYGTPSSQYSQLASPPQGPVTWQSLKPTSSVSSHYDPNIHGRTPSFGNQLPNMNQQHQQYPHMNPYGQVPPQPNGQSAPYGYQYQHQQQQQHQQHQQQYYHAQNAGAGAGQYQQGPGAPPVPSKDPHLSGQPPRVPDNTKHNQNHNSSLNGPFVAELE